MWVTFYITAVWIPALCRAPPLGLFTQGRLRLPLCSPLLHKPLNWYFKFGWFGLADALKAEVDFKHCFPPRDYCFHRAFVLWLVLNFLANSVHLKRCILCAVFIQLCGNFHLFSYSQTRKSVYFSSPSFHWGVFTVMGPPRVSKWYGELSSPNCLPGMGPRLSSLLATATKAQGSVLLAKVHDHSYGSCGLCTSWSHQQTA